MGGLPWAPAPRVVSFDDADNGDSAADEADHGGRCPRSVCSLLTLHHVLCLHHLQSGTGSALTLPRV